MEILDFAARFKLNKPSDNDLPEKNGKYYTVDYNGDHKIMEYSFHGFNNGTSWDGGYGEHSMKYNEDIYVWTEILPITLPE